MIVDMAFFGRFNSSWKNLEDFEDDRLCFKKVGLSFLKNLKFEAIFAEIVLKSEHFKTKNVTEFSLVCGQIGKKCFFGSAGDGLVPKGIHSGPAIHRWRRKRREQSETPDRPFPDSSFAPLCGARPG